MTICDRTFELVKEQLLQIGYTGPTALSCDDTKLFSALRMYWDGEQQSHFIVGAVNGPIRVVTPEEVEATMNDPAIDKGTKVRLWCLQIPLPKMAPILVAALPIPNTLDARTLLGYLVRILEGLHSQQIFISSYSCDGTEVERSVQRQLVQKSPMTLITIENPREGSPSTVVTAAMVHQRPLIMVQDSKHGLKTFRNNLFSGARALCFGNYTSFYGTIRQIIFNPSSPLYKRDVEKLDRQDDNAAARLFSAATLEHLSKFQPDQLGEIVYLFVFGELIDAYQNRSISHVERVKLVLRARYFLDMWRTYLDKCGYKHAQYYISREATDIARILIEGLIGLVILYRDHVSQDYPLLPWLHSTETCEHVFGEARRVVKDFTMLDFCYMASKLRVKVREAVLRQQASDPTARASGYCHTYFDVHGIDLLALATYPTDVEINQVALEAAQEAESLVLLLGVIPGQLLRFQSLSQVQQRLPAIASWYSGPAIAPEDSDDESDESESENEAEELQHLLNAGESQSEGRSGQAFLEISCGALALATDDIVRV